MERASKFTLPRIALRQRPSLSYQISLVLIGEGWAFGALLHQRGLTPLHVSALATPHGVIAFTGASGARKSTLASYLNQHFFWPIISDDVAVAEIAEGAPRLQSGPSTVKLWQDALRELELNTDGLRRDLTHFQKFHALGASRFLQGSVELKRLIHPTWGDTPKYQQAKRRSAFRIALGTVYRPDFARLFANTTRISNTALANAAHVKIALLTPRAASRH